MPYVSKKLKLNKRRAISNIIGSLILLAIVASMGSVILFQGLNQINAFNYDLTLYEKEKVNEIREKIIFEQVTFDITDPEQNDLILYLANIGTVDSTISSISVVNVDTQELILERVQPSANATILIEDNQVIHLNTTITGGWNSSAHWDSTYQITVGTSKGNFETTFEEPPFGT